jgi:hypothetical protein
MALLYLDLDHFKLIDEVQGLRFSPPVAAEAVPPLFGSK